MECSLLNLYFSDCQDRVPAVTALEPYSQPQGNKVFVAPYCPWNNWSSSKSKHTAKIMHGLQWQRKKSKRRLQNLEETEKNRGQLSSWGSRSRSWGTVEWSEVFKIGETVQHSAWQRYSEHTATENNHSTTQYSILWYNYCTVQQTAQQHCTDRTTNYSFKCKKLYIQFIVSTSNRQKTREIVNIWASGIKPENRLTTSLKHKIRGLESLSFRHPTLDRLGLTTSLKTQNKRTW